MGLSFSVGAFVQIINRLFQDKEKFPYLYFYVDDLMVTSSSLLETP